MKKKVWNKYINLLIRLGLSMVASIFIFLGTLFSGNWEMLYIKLPNFEGLHLDLGMIYNKNIIFLIKIIFYSILIIYDLYLICSGKIKELNDNYELFKTKKSRKEIEMINLEI